MTLSQRIRGGIEAAPWVLREVLGLEAERDALKALLAEAQYALDYASDMTKPEGMSGCDCPICTTLMKIDAALKGQA